MKFENIVKMNQGDLKNALVQELRKNGYRAKASNKYIYTKGKVPVLLVAHMDTAHRTAVKTLCVSECGTYYMSPEGIGGDDRSGVWMILQIIKKLKCHVLFCEDEESGAVGARAFVKSGIKPKVNYIVEIDRRGSNDAVFYGCDNPKFTKFVTGFGFEEEHGSFSDISVIAPALGIAAVNISAGYWNEHTLHEYVSMDAMKRNVELIANMAATKSEKFEYIEKSYSYYHGSNAYIGTSHSYRRYGMAYGYNGYEDYDGYYKYDFAASGKKQDEGTVMASLVPDSAIVCRADGTAVDGDTTYMVDRWGNIYEWLDEYICAYKLEGYTAYKVTVTQYSTSRIRLYMDSSEADEYDVVTEDEALELLESDTTYYCEIHGYSANSDYCLTCEKEAEQYLCENETCEGKYDPDMCMECYKDSSSLYTWNDIKNTMSDDEITFYMDMVWSEGNDYPQYTDPVPDWVTKVIMKEAALAS